MEQNTKIHNSIISGIIWKFGERIIAQGVSFIISLILARILLPNEYGTISLVIIFINIANVFVSDGMGASLIQKKDANDIDFSTMFFCGLGLSLFLYVVLFILAPAIARFYDNPELKAILRVLAISVPLTAFKTIQSAYISKHMMFKKYFWSTLGGTVISGIIGIVMACNGFGAWALVEQYLVNAAIDSIILFITVDWRPRFLFSRRAAGKLFGYSWKLLLSQLVNTVYTECRSLVIGKIYTQEDLAYANKANQFPSLIINNINASISAVLFPAMSSVNHSADDVKLLTRKSMRITSYVIFPMMIGMSVIAEPMVSVLLTDKWLPCVPYLRLWCLYWLVQPCQTANVQAIKAMGRSDICLKLEIVKKIIGFLLIFATMFISIDALMISNSAFAIISALINVFPNKKLIGYGYRAQFSDLYQSLCLAIIMGVVIWSMSLLPFNNYILLLLQIFSGIAVYVGGSEILKNDSYIYIKDNIKSIFLSR